MPASQTSDHSLVAKKIREVYRKKGVTILLDLDDDSDTARMGSSYEYDQGRKQLKVIVSNLTPADKDVLFEIVREIFNENFLIWKSSKEETLESFNEYTSNKEDNDTLQLFSKIISKDDLDALRLSLFLRAQSKRGKSIDVYKQDIRDKFGDRGANISNLCSAGYFEHEFIPLYQQSTTDDFKEYYELAVGKKARALFVHASMNANDIEEEVNAMVNKAITYRMGDFRIHAKGASNVAKLTEFVRTREGNEDYTVTIEFDKAKLNAIEYRVEIKPELL